MLLKSLLDAGKKCGQMGDADHAFMLGVINNIEDCASPEVASANAPRSKRRSPVPASTEVSNRWSTDTAGKKIPGFGVTYFDAMARAHGYEAPSPLVTHLEFTGKLSYAINVCKKKDWEELSVEEKKGYKGVNFSGTQRPENDTVEAIKCDVDNPSEVTPTKCVKEATDVVQILQKHGYLVWGNGEGMKVEKHVSRHLTVFHPLLVEKMVQGKWSPPGGVSGAAKAAEASGVVIQESTLIPQTHGIPGAQRQTPPPSNPYSGEQEYGAGV
jgi:hypothetical protein